MTKRYEGQIADKKKEYESLYLKKATILKTYNEKVKQLRVKGQEISELIQKAKADGGADKGLLDILNKWEEANQKIFDRTASHDGENENDNEFSLLEAAHQEMNKAKEAQLEEKKQLKKKKNQQAPSEAVNTSIKEDEEEMRRYMEELKRKEEELQQRMHAKEQSRRETEKREERIRKQKDEEERLAKQKLIEEEQAKKQLAQKTIEATIE